ncbi:hypothetical protein, partial [Pseudomonas sp. RL]|uniref:hypothetical protein n=1 Tax=Pseudomonas sp. RL TaxID=1452718 RepID=UPI00055C0D3A
VDLLHAMQALSQLSYSPVRQDGAHIRFDPLPCQQYFSTEVNFFCQQNKHLGKPAVDRGFLRGWEQRFL